ncbi:MAG TPA: hypothetical protein VHU18_11475 [Rhizomicrobium sp.]|nr:hypothetical protein [Rhizomicrobium sp.]
MRASVLIIAALLGLCQPGRADSLSDIRAIRSIAAEAAQVLNLEDQHKVTATYATVMKNQAISQLRNTAESAESPQTKQLAQQAIDAVKANDSAALKRFVQKLYAMEAAHGRAD